MSKVEMTDTISRTAAIDAILHNRDLYADSFNGDAIDQYTVAIIENDADTIAQLPSVDVVPMEPYKQTAWERDIAIEQLKELGYSLGEKVRHGHWIELDGNDANYFCCDRCGRRSDFKEPFCPNCGTKMEGGKNETD